MNGRVSKMLRTLATVEGELRKDILKELKIEWHSMPAPDRKVWVKNGKEVIK